MKSLKSREYISVFLCIVALYVADTNAMPCYSSTYGTEFYFGIMEAIDNCCHGVQNKVVVDITNVSPNTTYVRVQIPYSNLDQNLTIPAGTRRSIDIDPAIQKEGLYLGPRGIRVSSNNLVSVLVTNAFDNEHTIDSYNVLPVKSVGKDYMISSYTNSNSDRGSRFMVAGIYDNTTIEISNGSHVVYAPGTMKSLDVFQYKLHKFQSIDLSGLRLKSNKKVFVVSGAAFIKISDPYGTSDYIASELYPIDTWSRTFIVPPILPRRLFILRVQSTTAAIIDVRNGSRSFTIKSSTSDHYFGSIPVSITSNRSIVVTQYGLTGTFDHTHGDPFMAMVPSIDQYVNDLKFNIPDEIYDTKSYMTIVVPKIYSTNLVLDSNKIFNNVTQLPVASPFDNYTVLTFPTTPGFHHLYHPIENARFCVLVQQIGHDMNSGFYPGYNLNGTCSNHEVTTRQPQTTVTSPYKTTQHWGNYTGGQYQCYSCEDMTHNELCDTIKQCGQQEVCYVESYLKSGRIVYRSGCLAENVCTRLQGLTFNNCVECCHGNFCNNKGCGDSGLPERPHRGPVCFDCQHVFTPDECTTVTVCDPAQVCSIEEFPWGDHSHYKMGCAYELCDPLKRSITHRQDRSLPICHGCCEDDFCNRNCTIIKDGANVIVG